MEAPILRIFGCCEVIRRAQNAGEFTQAGVGPVFVLFSKLFSGILVVFYLFGFCAPVLWPLSPTSIYPYIYIYVHIHIYVYMWLHPYAPPSPSCFNIEELR